EGITSDIKFNLSRDGSGGSDQTSFYKKDIPVLFFHTGGHPDYHKTGDDAHKIDYKSLKSILELEIKVLDNSMKVPKMDFIWTNLNFISIQFYPLILGFKILISA